ncbi:MAG: hypothetical protein HYZ49_19275 [Chloroflexi bacterium]|nr:hypothetical protein [Chloroflexota bacterium]
MSDVGKNLQHAASEALSKAKDAAASLQDSHEKAGERPKPIHQNVSVIVFNPTIKSEGGKKLSEVMGWSKPDELTQKYIADVKEASYGYITYGVVERIEVDGFPAKKDGFVYKAEDFLKHLRAGSGFHTPDEVDYKPILEKYEIVEKVNRGSIDEVWLYAFPYAGFYESIMGGPGAFWCNAPVLEGADQAKKRFVIMGFNYERGAGQMLENLGHRAESIMKHTYRHKSGDDNLWERFTRYDKTHPGQSEVGIVHYAPNSTKDYEWGNKTKVKSRYHVWKNFPNLEGVPIEVDDSHWGGGDIREHHMWWFKLMPHITGSGKGIAYNWWQYIIDPNLVN